HGLGGVIAGPPRFTPTHVGKTWAKHGPENPATVHPHARGEDMVGRDRIGHRLGSPPRTWGRRRLPPSRAGSARFTPTHVGKTCLRCCPVAPPAVHPHARGEDIPSSACEGSSSGSPPRMWGRHGPRRFGRVGSRFTPTHVGKTSPTSRRARWPAVHP